MNFLCGHCERHLSRDVEAQCCRVFLCFGSQGRMPHYWYSYLFFWSQLLHCVMWFSIEDIGLGLGFRDQFKENDERSKGFMSGLSGRFFYVVGGLELLRERIRSSMFRREHLPCCGNSGGKMEFWGCTWVLWKEFVGMSNPFLFLCPTSKDEGSGGYMFVIQYLGILSAYMNCRIEDQLALQRKLESSDSLRSIACFSFGIKAVGI